jgi:hypothetical protein
MPQPAMLQSSGVGCACGSSRHRGSAQATQFQQQNASFQPSGRAGVFFCCLFPPQKTRSKTRQSQRMILLYFTITIL